MCQLWEVLWHVMWILPLRHTINECTNPICNVYLWYNILNPSWHELWKQEKCLSLEPPRGIFYKAQWAKQGVKLTRLMSIVTSKKVWKFFIKIQLPKSDPKRTGVGKCPASCQLELNLKITKIFWHILFSEASKFCLLTLKIIRKC